MAKALVFVILSSFIVFYPLRILEELFPFTMPIQGESIASSLNIQFIFLTLFKRDEVTDLIQCLSTFADLKLFYIISSLGLLDGARKWDRWRIRGAKQWKREYAESSNSYSSSDTSIAQSGLTPSVFTGCGLLEGTLASQCIFYFPDCFVKPCFCILPYQRATSHIEDHHFTLLAEVPYHFVQKNKKRNLISDVDVFVLSIIVIGVQLCII
ncbi:hypothetical protein EGR_09479 [Echinococcus granulosus]|uniref:Uncharacterized protein n=1 Tax=Echinococcus granulosus TaxID=6210 RepID=W6U536_ECHGR|nr:hypothetical protein EGR_09479 [Echinococcus granulosus]EUB55671.1 hypothetical protein EGR_09479 [Echinococcus granulosus]